MSNIALEEARKRRRQNAIAYKLKDYQKQQENLVSRYGNYNAAEYHEIGQANAYYNAVGEMRDLTDLYRYYVDTYDSNNKELSKQLGDAVANYDKILSSKDLFLGMYSQHNTPESFKAAFDQSLKDGEKYGAENYNIEENEAILDQLYKDRDVFKGFELSLDMHRFLTEPISDGNGGDIYFADYFPDYDKNADLTTHEGSLDAFRSVNPDEKIRALEAELSKARLYQSSGLDANVDFATYSLPTKAAEKALNREAQDKYFTDKEKARYYYLYNTQGAEKASQYANDLLTNLDARQLEALREFSGRNLWTAALGSLLSFGTSAASMLESIGKQTGFFMSAGTEEMGDIYMARITDAYRSGASSAVGDAFGDVGKFLYNVNTSGAESYLASLIPYGLGGLLLGANAAASAINSALDRGATSEDAYYSGLAAGVFETLFESVSIGKIRSIKEILGASGKKSVKEIVKQLALSIGVNATEEALTEVANITYDTLAMGDISHYELAIQEYINQGMSEEEAKSTVAKELGLQVGEAALSGAIMGGMFTGSAAIETNARIADAEHKYFSKEGKNILNNAESAEIIEEYKWAANNDFKDVDAVAKAAKQYEKKQTASRLGRLVYEVDYESNKRDGFKSQKQRREELKKALAADAAEKKALAERASEDVKSTIDAAHAEAQKVRVSNDGSGIKFGKMPPIADYTDALSAEIVIKDQEGNETKLSEVTVADEDVTHAYLFATSLGSVDAANSFISAYNAETDNSYVSPETFYIDWLSIQSHGQTSTWDGAMEKAFAAVGDRMSENAKSAAFLTGRGLRESSNKKFQEEQDKYDKAWKDAGGKTTDAKFDDSALRGKKLSDDQKDYASFLRVYSRAMGTNVEVFYSEKGERKGKENGSYNRATNTLRIDINAGISNKATYDAVQNNVVGTLSHETVHNMRVTANKQYESLRDFVISVLEKDPDYDLEEAIETEIKQYKEDKNQDIDREDAIEEIVARACEDRLASSEALKNFLIDLYAHDKSAANGFVKAVKEFLTRLKEFFAKIVGMKSNATEAQKFAEMGDDIVSELQKLFDEGVLAMREGNIARNAVKEANVNIDVATDGATMYSNRYQASDTNSDILSMVKKVADGNFKANEKVNLGTVSDATATEIYNITGIDVKGFKVAIEARQIEHIIKDHGKNGTTDRSMANPSDIAKIEYALKDYDDIRLAGKTQAYTQMVNGKNRTADTVLYEKSIGEKSYYVVQAVPDTKAKTLYIVTAFIGKKGYKKEASQLINAKSLDVTAKTGSVNASINSISQDQQKSSDFGKNSSDKLTQRRIELPTSSEILEDVFKSGKAYEKYAEHSQSLKKYKDLQVRLKNSEKRIAEIDAEIKTLRSERKQSGKGTRMDELYRMRKTAENKVENYRNQMFTMEAKELSRVVESESRRIALEIQKAERQKYAQKSKERTQNIVKRGYIDMIEKRIKLLSNAVAENSKEKHVPEVFKLAVGNFINAIDTSSKRYLMGGEPTKKDESLANSIKAMSEALTKVDDPELNKFLEACDITGDAAKEFKDIADKITEIALNYGNRNDIILQHMSADDLKDLNRSVLMLTHLISAANKLIGGNRYQKVTELYNQTVTDLKDYELYKKKETGTGASISRSINYSNTLPYFAFKRMGDAAFSLFEEFQDGFDNFAFKARAILAFADETFTGKEAKIWSKEIHKIELQSGTIYMTTADIMSFYCLAKRNDAKKHITGGGIQVGNRTGKLVDSENAKTQTFVNSMDGVVIDEAAIHTIISKLDDNDRAREVADKLQRFMADECARWGNEISYKRFGTRQFLDPTYFPIESSVDVIDKDGMEKARKTNIYSILNMSFTHKLVPNANNKIAVRNIFDVFSEHAVQMAQYNAFALPLIDIRKWQNFSMKTGENLGAEGKGFTEKTVRGMLKNAFGADAERYIDTFLSDLNGLQDTDRDMGLLKKLMSRYKVQAVAANINVTLIQPISYLRIYAVMDARYVLAEVKDTFKIREAIKTAEQYSGIMVWKSLGYRDVNLAASITDKIKHNESFVQRLNENVTLKGAELMDKLTWGAIWLACENETKSKKKDLTPGSEEFYKTVAKRFREVIYATQVVDSPLTKTQFMRSKTHASMAMGSFMSESSQSYNLFLDVASEISDDRRKGKKLNSKHIKRLARVSAVALMSSFAEALLRSFTDAMHDYDEDDEEYFELYLSNFAETFFSSLLAPKTPLLKYVFEAIKGSVKGGFSSSSAGMDVSGFEKIGRIIRYITRFVQGKDVSLTQLLKTMLDAFSSFSGIPLSNVWREIKSVWNIIVGSQNPSALIN